MLTPYQPIGDRNVVQFFDESGYEVAAIHGLCCVNTTDAIAGTPFSEVFDAVNKIDDDSVDAIVQRALAIETMIEGWIDGTIEAFIRLGAEIVRPPHAVGVHDERADVHVSMVGTR